MDSKSMGTITNIRFQEMEFSDKQKIDILGKEIEDLMKSLNYLDQKNRELTEENKELKEENYLLKNPIKKKQGDRGKQKGYHYRVFDTNTNEEKLFRTMKEISQDYNVSITGINNHVRGWKIKKYDHLDISYINKKC